MFDWLLLWDNVPAVEAMQPLFLAQQWDTSMRSSWLRLASQILDGSQTVLVQSCLEHDADPLIADEKGFIPLQPAIDSGCSGPVLDILSAATFAADTNLRADVFRSNEVIHLVDVILPKCSGNIIDFWCTRGLLE